MLRQNNSLNLHQLVNTTVLALVQSDINQATHCIQLILHSQCYDNVKNNALQDIAKNYISRCYTRPDDLLVDIISHLPVNNNIKIILLVNIAKAYVESKHIYQVRNIVQRIACCNTESYPKVHALQHIQMYCTQNSFSQAGLEINSIILQINNNQLVNNLTQIVDDVYQIAETLTWMNS